MSVYEIVTDKLIAQLEKGTIPWRKPWATTAPKNLISKRAYSGINLLLLSCSDFKSPWWLTFKQCKDLGGTVKKGAKSTLVTFWTKLEKKDQANEEDKKYFNFMRYYLVFNLEQCDGIEAPKVEERTNVAPIQACENVIREFESGPLTSFGGNKACYIPAQDVIQMPEQKQFKTDAEFYSTLFHETVHSTGAKNRLDRPAVSGAINFGSEPYSKEELIAEIGAGFLCAETGIENTTLENSAAYIASWLDKLNKDKRIVVAAAGAAQRAVNYILHNDTREAN